MSAAILVEAVRIRQAQPVKAPVAIKYRDDGRELPTLTLMSNWQTRKQQYRDVDTYTVEEIPTGMDGRAFLLHRDPATVEAEGPDADAYYGVLVARNGQDHECECKGFQAHGRCKHHDALRSLLEAGHIGHTLAGSLAPPVSNEVAPF
ncbi:MAG TPA: hypothetical protein VHR66_33010 [Gemmataceae bacterium]|nr:hypothetical protein [Gemmataceae bacterium]